MDPLLQKYTKQEQAYKECALGSAVAEGQHRARIENLEAADLSEKMPAGRISWVQLRESCSLENGYVSYLFETVSSKNHVL